MWTLVADKWKTLTLKARYQRVVHERLIGLTEASHDSPVAEDPGRWQLLGGDPHGLNEPQRSDSRTEARRLALHNPHARNILRLLEAYVTGPGLTVTHRARGSGDADQTLVDGAARLWTEFLDRNASHYSAREHARRAWRDGECFVRKFSSADWPPAVRFVDPESIGPTPESPDSQGILTGADDVETPVAYLRVDTSSGRLAEQIDASEMLHTRIGVDSNQKRGVTVFLPILQVLDCFNKWIETELTARKLQSSIVLWRKVQGGPHQAASVADGLAAGSDPDGMKRETVRPGTILTTSHGTDVQFLHPNTNFGDAVPLGRVLLLCTAAGAGLPEFMLTSDASNANFASTMIAEGPAVKLFQSEQQFFAGEFTRMWQWVLAEAVSLGLLPADFSERIEPVWTFPQLVNRDRPRERLADVRLVESRILSRAEVARRDGADPQAMREELESEATE